MAERGRKASHKEKVECLEGRADFARRDMAKYNEPCPFCEPVGRIDPGALRLFGKVTLRPQ